MRSFSNSKTMNRKVKKVLVAIAIYCILIVICGVFFFPCLWLILSSFSSTGSLYDIEGFFPSSFSFDAFIKLFTDTSQYNYPMWLLNTLIIAICNCILSTLLIIGTAYAISYFQFKARKSLMKGALVLSMFPSFMGMTVIYILMTQFNFVNNIWGLILIYSCTAPLGYLVQKGFFDTIPQSIYEAAKIDGCGDFAIFLKIIIPLSRPIIAVMILYAVVGYWNNYFNALLYVQDTSLFPLQKVLQDLLITNTSSVGGGDVDINMAEQLKYVTIVVSSLPLLVIYPFFQKYFEKGVIVGGVKG